METKIHFVTKTLKTLAANFIKAKIMGHFFLENYILIKVIYVYEVWSNCINI